MFTEINLIEDGYDENIKTAKEKGLRLFLSSTFLYRDEVAYIKKACRAAKDGKLNYILSMNIAREYFGKDINNVLKAIPGSDNIKALDVDVKIGGTLDKPTVSPDLTKALKSIEKEATKNLKKDLLKGLNKLFK